MKGRNKTERIPVLKHVFSLSFQLPISLVDQDQNSRSKRTLDVEQFWVFLEMLVLEDDYQLLDVGPFWHLESEIFLVVEEEFESSAEFYCDVDVVRSVFHWFLIVEVLG